jgi:hypothetical protein
LIPILPLWLAARGGDSLLVGVVHRLRPDLSDHPIGGYGYTP